VSFHAFLSARSKSLPKLLNLILAAVALAPIAVERADYAARRTRGANHHAPRKRRIQRTNHRLPDGHLASCSGGRVAWRSGTVAERRLESFFLTVSQRQDVGARSCPAVFLALSCCL